MLDEGKPDYEYLERRVAYLEGKLAHVEAELSAIDYDLFSQLSERLDAIKEQAAQVRYERGRATERDLILRGPEFAETAADRIRLAVDKLVDLAERPVE